MKNNRQGRGTVKEWEICGTAMEEAHLNIYYHIFGIVAKKMKECSKWKEDGQANKNGDVTQQSA